MAAKSKPKLPAKKKPSGDNRMANPFTNARGQPKSKKPGCRKGK